MLLFVLLVVPSHAQAHDTEAFKEITITDWMEGAKVLWVIVVSHSFPQDITWNSGRRS